MERRNGRSAMSAVRSRGVYEGLPRGETTGAGRGGIGSAAAVTGAGGAPLRGVWGGYERGTGAGDVRRVSSLRDAEADSPAAAGADPGARQRMMITMRQPCLQCGAPEGEIRPVGGQNVVWCAGCGKHAGYNAPKSETGEARTSLKTRPGQSGSQRGRIILRATARCELCGAGGHLDVGHLLSRADFPESGMTEAEEESDENKCAMCKECNSNLNRLSINARLYVALLRRRTGEQGCTT